jgi:hypothetical protein
VGSGYVQVSNYTGGSGYVNLSQDGRLVAVNNVALGYVTIIGGTLEF